VKARASARWNIRVEQIDCDGGELQVKIGFFAKVLKVCASMLSLDTRNAGSSRMWPVFYRV
jgi:hypothetical protein